MHINECVVLVVDPTHARYDQLGEIRYHDFNESGQVGVRFTDTPGTIDLFDDGQMSNDAIFPQVRIIEKAETAEIDLVHRRLTVCRLYLQWLWDAKGRDRSLEYQLAAKKEFWRVLREGPVEETEGQALFAQLPLLAAAE